MGYHVDIAGQRFGRLTVLRPVGVRSRRPICRLWLCRCDCGREHVTDTNRLTKGNVLSCGCLARGVEIALGRTVADAAARVGLSASSLRHRIKRGEPPALAAARPRVHLGRLVTFRGQTRNLSEWAAVLGISREAMRQRLRSTRLTRTQIFTARGFGPVAASALSRAPRRRERTEVLR